MKKSFISILLITLIVLIVISIMSITISAASTFPPDDTPLNYSDVLLDFDMNLIESVGHQKFDGYACSCYALAYAKTILDGYVHRYYEYNQYGQTEYSVNAVWTWGNYWGAGYPEERLAYFYLYQDIQNGKPSIAQVRGSSGNTHFVTVVGFKNVTSFEELGPENFIIIDPGVSNFTTLKTMAERGYVLYTSTSVNPYFIVRPEGRLNSVGFASSTEYNNYVNQYCTKYPSNAIIEMLQDYTPRSLPCNNNTASALGFESVALTDKALKKGERVTVAGIYYNSERNYWYKVIFSDKTVGYIYSDRVTWIGFDEPYIQNGSFPSNISGATKLEGTIKINNVSLETITAKVYKGNTTSGSAVITATDSNVNSSSYPLKDSKLDINLPFQNLANYGAGTYTLVYSAQYTTYFINGGVLVPTIEKPIVAYYTFTYGTPTACSHSYTSSITLEPTCTNYGIRTYKCTKCSVQYTETIPATGNHIYDSGVISLEPTCSNYGIKTYTCTKCNIKSTETIPATGQHIESDWILDYGATFGQPGREHTECINCGTLINEQSVSKVDEGKDGDIGWYITSSGLLTIYNVDSDSCEMVSAPWLIYAEYIKRVTMFAGGISSICDYAFDNCVNLETVLLSDDATSIGAYAFRNCTSLNRVTYTNSLTTIGYGAFYNCTSLERIDIYDCLEYIDHFAFYNCSSLASIGLPNGLTTIGDSAFSCCSSLKDVVIPESVTTIHAGAFNGCASLTDITLPSSITDIKDWTFTHCTSLESIVIPKGVTSIGLYTFFNCPSLTNVYFEGSRAEWNQITIDSTDNANYDLTSTNIHYWGGDQCDHSYGKTVFREADCQNYGIIKYTCIYCSDSYFDYPPQTEHSISIIQSNDSSYPFELIDGIYNSTNKTDNTSSVFTLNAVKTGFLTISYSVSSEHYYDKLIIEKNGTVLVTVSGQISWTDTTIDIVAGDVVTITYSKDVSESNGSDTCWFTIKESGNGTAPTCTENVVCCVCQTVIKEATGHIYVDGACENCGNKNGTSNTVINKFSNWEYIVYENVNTIAPYGWTTGTNTVSWITAQAPFSGSFYANPSSNTIFEYDYFRCYMRHTFTINNNDITSVTMFIKYDEEPIVYINGIKVWEWTENTATNNNYVDTMYVEVDLSAYAYAFKAGENIIAVDWRNQYGGSVMDLQLDVSISEECVNHVESDWIIDVPVDFGQIGHKHTECIYCGEQIQSSYIDTIDSGYDLVNDIHWSLDYTGCLYIGRNGEIYSSSVNIWGKYRTNITEVYINYGVTAICDGVFSEFTALNKVTIPDSVESIGNYAFWKCTSLTNISIPNSVTNIGENAFFGSGLRSLIIPGSIKTVGIDAFMACYSLKTITIEEGVTEVFLRMFSDCRALETITIPKSVTYIGQMAFGVCNSLTTVYYEGTRSEWNKIKINSLGNDDLTNANIIFAIDNVKEGFVTEADGTRYYYADGSFATGWATINGKTYRFDPNTGILYTASVLYGANTYYFNADHSTVEGIVYEDGGMRFYKKGVRQYGWVDFDGDGKGDSYFYVSSQLRCEEDRVLFDGVDARRFFKYNPENGHMEIVNGFYTNENGTQFFKNGLGQYGWITADGVSITDRPGITLSDVHYFAYGDGLNFYMIEDAKKTIGGVVREFDENHLVKSYTGWATNKTTGNANYYVEGVLQQGWCETPDGWVYLSRAENPANKITYGDVFYGWRKIGGKVYYFRASTSTPQYTVISDPSRDLTYEGVRSTYYINQTIATGTGADYYITNPPAGF